MDDQISSDQPLYVGFSQGEVIFRNKLANFSDHRINNGDSEAPQVCPLPHHRGGEENVLLVAVPTLSNIPLPSVVLPFWMFCSGIVRKIIYKSSLPHIYLVDQS